MSVDVARKQAFLLLEDIITNNKYANLSLKNGLNGFDERDKAFICTLVYGTLDKLIAVDYIISLFAKGRVQPRIKNILRMGVYQIVYLDRVPDSAAVNSSVELAQSIGKGALKGYVNGVLRNISKNKQTIEYPIDKCEFISVKYGFPLFIVNELIKDLGADEAERFCAYEGNKKTTLRVDTAKAEADEIRIKLNGEKSRFFDNCFYIDGKPSMLENGVCSVQGEASVAVVKALEPQRGERILDACAAPGGKTIYIASLMGSGEIVACDKHIHRVELIRKNSVRCGYEDIIKPTLCDMCEQNDLGSFDRVLVDAPCSGLGVLEQKPEIKHTATPEGFAEIENIQRKILANAAEKVKCGGVLVYSTCTIRDAENISVINEFLNEHNDFKLEPFTDFRNGGLTEGYIRLYPHIDKTDGFFIARMRRN